MRSPNKHKRVGPSRLEVRLTEPGDRIRAGECVGPTINPLNPNKGDVVTVEATPNDGTVNGTLVSNTVTVANSAPVVTNVVISPSSPTTNQTITATPTATDGTATRSPSPTSG